MKKSTLIPATIIAFVTILAAGCSIDSDKPMVWVKKGSGQAALDMDDAQCRNEARAIAVMNRAVGFWNVFHDCMVGRGWTRIG